jgi:tRNA(fMet)-specific endonuclease VapC
VSDSGLLLLDTSVVLHLVRGKEIGMRMDRDYNLRGRTDRPLISVITVAEARAFALRLGWGPKNADALESLLRQLVVVDINHAPILRLYAEIHAFLEKNGRAVGDNDKWIAATAAATGAVLVTNDKDFDPLQGTFLTRVYVPVTTGSS